MTVVLLHALERYSVELEISKVALRHKGQQHLDEEAEGAIRRLQLERRDARTLREHLVHDRLLRTDATKDDSRGRARLPLGVPQREPLVQVVLLIGRGAGERPGESALSRVFSALTDERRGAEVLEVF